jgi:hypothetical protein
MVSVESGGAAVVEVGRAYVFELPASGRLGCSVVDAADGLPPV